MESNTRKKINDVADTIREALEITTPIENIDVLVEKLHGRVERKNVLSESADGKIYREGEGFVIEIPQSDNKYREKFTIAHEIGHLFLHMGYLIDDEIWDQNKDKVYFRKELGEMEYQAHEFAAALLMPREKFFEVMNENYDGNGVYNMEKVAQYFKVSIEAATNRGRWLGILAWG